MEYRLPIPLLDADGKGGFSSSQNINRATLSEAGATGISLAAFLASKSLQLLENRIFMFQEITAIDGSFIVEVIDAGIMNVSLEDKFAIFMKLLFEHVRLGKGETIPSIFHIAESTFVDLDNIVDTKYADRWERINESILLARRLARNNQKIDQVELLAWIKSEFNDPTKLDVTSLELVSAQRFPSEFKESTQETLSDRFERVRMAIRRLRRLGPNEIPNDKTQARMERRIEILETILNQPDFQPVPYIDIAENLGISVYRIYHYVQLLIQSGRLPNKLYTPHREMSPETRANIAAVGLAIQQIEKTQNLSWQYGGIDSNTLANQAGISMIQLQGVLVHHRDHIQYHGQLGLPSASRQAVSRRIDEYVRKKMNEGMRGAAKITLLAQQDLSSHIGRKGIINAITRVGKMKKLIRQLYEKGKITGLVDTDAIAEEVNKTMGKGSNITAEIVDEEIQLLQTPKRRSRQRN